MKKLWIFGLFVLIIVSSFVSADSSQSNTSTICNVGCSLNNNCVSLGYRTFEAYCDINNQFVQFKPRSAQCSNNFECSSNFCNHNQCINPNIFQRIARWFSSLFNVNQSSSSVTETIIAIPNVTTQAVVSSTTNQQSNNVSYSSLNITEINVSK